MLTTLCDAFFFFQCQFIVQGYVLPILHIASHEFGDAGGGVR